ncbi:hypothetical protein EUGRSUZ_A00068 [Eucalyptus grandis]|uniref:Uncharacterized protein n=2 Tax=Eucalyptus grandis TaxID=71139 RepID=A0ACC3M007_EUCGR|nr:hypothetical protein EUGRSUZ_A00068 [Eucalyptus grandis]
MPAFGRYKCLRGQGSGTRHASWLLDLLGKGIESALVYPSALVAEPWQLSSEMFSGIDPEARAAELALIPSIQVPSPSF